MKIVTKEAHLRIEPIEVLEESPTYYIDVFGIARSKKHYEPIPEVTWRDVTAECEFKHCVPHHSGVEIFEWKGYQVRKVGMKELHDLWRGQDYPYAFVIEKKEPA